MTATAAMMQILDGLLPKVLGNSFAYPCTKLGALINKPQPSAD